MMDCPDKTRWKSGTQARRAARVTSSKCGEQMRAYACPECRGWHLSSSIPERAPKAQRRHCQGHARRLAPGQSLEDLAAQIRAERLEDA